MKEANARPQMLKHWRAVAAIGLVFSLIGLDAAAQSRDSDGTRMQARKVALGSSHSDSLTPSNDKVDWRYFQMSSSGEIAVELTHEPAEVELRVVLTTARGDEIASGVSRKGQLTLNRSLDPGIYYISVSASQAAKYRLSFR